MEQRQKAFFNIVKIMKRKKESFLLYFKLSK